MVDGAPSLETAGLTFSFVPGGAESLRNVTISLPQKARCLVVGHNGAGKSTLLELLAGNKMAPAGSVKVFGADPFRGSSGKQVALIQGGWRGADGLNERSAEFLRVWQLLGLSDPNQAASDADIEMDARTRSLFDLLGLMKLVDRYLGSLSDGERRKVELARKLKEPKQLVLLDEATMDLDLLARRAVLDFLARDDVAVVNVTHVFDGLEGWVTHFVHLHNGEVVKCEAVPAEGPRPWPESGGLFALVAEWLRAAAGDAALGSPPPAAQEPGGASDERIVRVSGLEFAYAEWCHVSVRLDGLELPSGCRCVLVGPNGAGKSTLLNILGSRRMVTKGDVRLAGHRAFHDHAALDRVVSLLSSEWKRQVSELTSGRALTFQEISATWMKDLQSSGFDMAAVAARLVRLIQMLKIDPTKPVGALSDGMLRRVQIALKLARPSTIVLVDEVTADLDALARQALLAFLREESEAGATVVYCTHIMDGLDGWATHVLRLRANGLDGELLSPGERMLPLVLKMLEEDAALPELPRAKQPRSSKEEEARLPSGWMARGATQAGAYGSYSWNADGGSEDTWTFGSVAPAPGAPQPARTGLQMMAEAGVPLGAMAPGALPGARPASDNPFGAGPRGNAMGYEQLVAQGVVQPERGPM